MQPRELAVARNDTTFVDDIDGSPAEVRVEFSVEGDDYEINLTKTNRNAFIRDLARFMAAARKVGGEGPKMHYQQTEADPRTVREWARANGYHVPDSRKVPKEIVDKFRAAGN